MVVGGREGVVLSQEGEHGEQVIVYSAPPCWVFGVDVFSADGSPPVLAFLIC